MRNPGNRHDPEPERLLETLRSVPARDPKLAQQGRARFLSEANTLRTAKAKPSNPFERAIQWMASLGSANRAGLSLRQISMAAIIAALVLLSGVSLTAYAAQSALPGEALYQVKLTLEDAFLAISQSNNNDLELHLDYAQRRVEEITALLDSGESQELGTATSRLGFHLEMAATILAQLQANDGNLSSETVNIFDELLTFYGNISASPLEDEDEAETEEPPEEENDGATENEDVEDEDDSQSLEDEEDRQEQDDGEDEGGSNEEDTDEDEDEEGEGGGDNGGNSGEDDEEEENTCDEPDEHGGEDDDEDEPDEEDSGDHDEEDSC